MNNNHTNTEETNNKKSNKLFAFLKKHKTKIFIGGTLVVASITAYVLKDSELPDQLQNILDNYKNKQDDTYTTTSSTDYYSDSFYETEDLLQSASFETDLELTPRIEQRTIDVRQFIRKMPDNCNASAEKIAEAEQLGIKLNDHETIVDSHPRKIAA